MVSSWIIAILIVPSIVIAAPSNSEKDMKGPVFLKEPENRIDFSNSTGSVVECRANASPPPEIIWVRSDGTAVGDVPGLRQVLPNGNLVFPPFRAEDYRQEVHAQVYRCLAKNQVGSIISREVHVRAGELKFVSSVEGTLRWTIRRLKLSSASIMEFEFEISTMGEFGSPSDSLGVLNTSSRSTALRHGHQQRVRDSRKRGYIEMRSAFIPLGLFGNSLVEDWRRRDELQRQSLRYTESSSNCCSFKQKFLCCVFSSPLLFRSLTFVTIQSQINTTRRRWSQSTSSREMPQSLSVTFHRS